MITVRAHSGRGARTAAHRSDWVLAPISLALDNLDQINNATDDHLKKVYGTLMMALNYGQP